MKIRQLLLLLLPTLCVAADVSDVAMGPELGFAFLQLHHQMSADIEKAEKADPEQARELRAGILTLYGVDYDAYVRITTASKVLQEKLSAWARNREQFVKPFFEQRKIPPHDAMVRFDKQREAIIVKTIDAMEQSLTEAARQSLQAYIQKNLRHQVTTGIRTVLQPKGGTER